METLNRTYQTYLENKLQEHMEEFLSEANEYIKKNNYHLSDNSKKGLEQLEGINWISYFQNTSKKTKKRFLSYFAKFRKKQSRSSLNRIFHFIHTKILSKIESETATSSWTGRHSANRTVSPDWIKKVRVEAPLKHQKIQEKRKKWKEAQAVAEKLLATYKKEKGNYYKMGSK